MSDQLATVATELGFFTDQVRVIVLPRLALDGAENDVMDRFGTLTAMMAGWLLKPHGEEHPGRAARAFERGFAATTRLYERTLGWVLRHRRTTLWATIGTVAKSGVLSS